MTQSDGHIMLAQFQARYSTGSLISELLQVYQGKFVVRVSAQVDGLTRATGMAAAETLELAEDRARSRALAVLGIYQSSSMPVETVTSKSVTSESQLLTTSELNNAYASVSPVLPVEDLTPAAASLESKGTDATNESLPEVNPLAPSQATEAAGTTVENLQPITIGNVTPITSRRPSPQASTNIGAAVSEPIDLSDTLIKIDVEIKTLRWTSDQEREYLERAYGKGSRQLLKNEELLEFLRYLELYAKTDAEIRRLEWSPQKGKDYLQRTYNKKARSLLTYQELLEFLAHLESQPSAKDPFV